MTIITAHGLRFDVAFDEIHGADRDLVADAVAAALSDLDRGEVAALHADDDADDDASFDRLNQVAYDAMRAATADWICWSDDYTGLAYPAVSVSAYA